MSNVTLIVTDNTRPDLLRRTLKSFEKFNTYPLADRLIHNDGKEKPMRSIKAEFSNYKWYFSGSVIGYAASLDFLLSRVETEYVFTLESDWLFYKNPGFIERSMKILEENPGIHQVWIRDKKDHTHPLLDPILVSGFRVYPVTYGYHEHWNGYSLNPALRRMRDIRTMFPNGLVEHRDEIDQAKHAAKFNYRAVSFVDSSIKHIGWNRRSKHFRP